MNEKKAIEYASDWIVPVSDDWFPERGVTRFRVGQSILTKRVDMYGGLWQVDESYVYIRSRGNAIEYCVNLKRMENRE